MKLSLLLAGTAAVAFVLRRRRATRRYEGLTHAEAEALPRRGPAEAEAESATRPRSATRYDELREQDEAERHDAAFRLGAKQA